MKHKIIFIGAFLLASSSAWAGQGLLEEAVKQKATDAATSAAPSSVKKALKAGETLQRAKTLTGATESPAESGGAEEKVKSTGESTESASETVKDPVKETDKAAAAEQDKEATAEGEQDVKAKQYGDTPAEKGESSAEPANPVVDAVKNKIQKKVTEKALDMVP